ncbi:stage V sporulation protein AE [Ruminococcus sp. Marseille-P6503]|uniref:stage V sporulation protein AE n=1 Tax=Ruminococcus sp. Marseille-P6503 TaxID=2364796 RepID=UPI000F527B45|nr:stage V sporulation protein AE [Ruminococcus sp. Marseille-P6503]
MEYLWAFLIGGLFCAVGQILIDFTKLTPARILVSYVVAGVILGALGLYKPIIDKAGGGATVPLTGFGYLLADGVKKAVDENGFLGIFTGGLTAAAAGICAAIVFGFITALFSRSTPKS